MSIGIVGTVGYPSNYGGFETLVKYLVEEKPENTEVRVYCESICKSYNFDIKDSISRIFTPFKANGWQSILYDCLSIIHSVRVNEKTLILGSSGGLVMLFRLFFKKHQFIVNIGGLDWQRDKWSYFPQVVLRWSESLVIRNANVIISDNEAIKEYIVETYGRDSILIAYGGDQAVKEQIDENDKQKYLFLREQFIFTLARIQKDNNIELIIQAYLELPNRRMPLVIIGNWKSSIYGLELRKKYSVAPSVYLLDAIYDQQELNKIRGRARLYVHGHSAGGTNPALVEAMNLNLNIICFDSVYNRYTTENKAKYFSNSTELSELMDDRSRTENGNVMKTIANSRYKWSLVINSYYNLFK